MDCGLRVLRCDSVPPFFDEVSLAREAEVRRSHSASAYAVTPEVTSEVGIVYRTRLEE